MFSFFGDTEIETKLLLRSIKALNDVLLRQLTSQNKDALTGVAQKDIKDNAFQRGFLIGLELALSCGGVPAFLSGDAVRSMNMRLAVLIQEFNITDFIKEARHA